MTPFAEVPMSRWIVPIVAALSGSVVLAAPKAGERPPIYLPTAVGAKLTYKAPDGHVVKTVTAVEEKDGRTVVTLNRKHSSGFEGALTYRLTGDGVSLVAYADKPYDPPVCVLALPVAAKKAWEYDLPLDGGPTARVKARVVGEEEVTVPAGKFKAVRVDTEFRTPRADPILSSEWYAVGIGLVREVVGGEDRYVLTSFTPGPAKK
jgi:hypothetical protein